MVLMNNFDEPTALLPQTLRFWNAHFFLVTFVTVSIAVAYFANWLISNSISDYEESSEGTNDGCTEVGNAEIDLKKGGEKLADFLSKMRKRELQTPPTERSFKAEIERANVRKVRNSGVIVESPKSPKSPRSDSFVSPISSEGTLRRYDFASLQQNTIVEEIKGHSDGNNDSSLRLPLEESDEEDELNIASSPEKIAIFCDCLTNEEPLGQATLAKDNLSQKRQISAMPAHCRIEQWVNEAAKARCSPQEAVKSPVGINATPLRGGGFLPPNFLTPSAKTYHRRRVTPGYELQKQLLSKKAIHSPTGDRNFAPTRTHPASTPNGGCFSASISNAIIFAQQRTMENTTRYGVGGIAAPIATVPPQQQAQPADYLTFAKGLSTFRAVVDPQTSSDMHLPSVNSHPTGSLQPTPQSTENRLNRGVIFDRCPAIIPIAGSDVQPHGDEQTIMKIQRNAGVAEKIINVESENKKGTPKRKHEHMNQANTSRRRHRHRYHQDIQQRTARLTVRKPGRRTEESLLNLFQRMPLDKQQAIIQKCSAKR